MNPPLPVQTQERFPGTLTSWEQQANLVVCHTDNQTMLHVHVLSDDILRFRFAPLGYFHPDFSYAIDPGFTPQWSEIKISEDEQHLFIQTQNIECRLQKQGLRTTLLDRSGKVLLEDDKGFHWEPSEHGGEIVMMSKQAHPEEIYFGLGDKSGHLNLRGQRLQNWNLDCFGYSSGSDPLYRSIPFYFGLREGDAYGVFFDNSFQTHFDFAMEREEATSFWAQGGEMNYYFIHGPELMQVAERYAHLTGRPELPPKWAMGFHQCKWSYYPETRVRELAHEFRTRKIPCDALYLDIDYMDGYRCFTWNHDYFPQPQKMIQDLRDRGFKTVVIIDPGIKIDLDYWVFEEGLELDAYLKRLDGPYAQGKVWPGECYFPDYTKAEGRTWWASLFKDLVRKMGVNGVWNDMNEPAAFEVESKTLPMDVMFHYEGNLGSHRKAHNIYGMQMSRASYEGVKDHAYPNRPFMITRATYAGGQRFASVWTGDNVANWEHLWLASIQTQRLSISGFSFAGSDIGGFNDMPDGELFVRWLQLGIFHPLCRVHSIGYNDAGDAAVDEDARAANEARGNRDQEPWSFGEPFTSIARSTIELRYKLLPVLYTAFWQYVQRGTPVLRPLSFLDQRDPETLHRMEEFCVGDHLLVAPVIAQGAEERGFYLPEGTWYDYETGESFQGGQEYLMDVALGTIPMFVRGGAVLPVGPVMQYTDERPLDRLDLHVYYVSGETTSQWYHDEGDGYDYEEGMYHLSNFTTKGDGQQMSLNQEVLGEMELPFTHFKVIIHGLDFKGRRCQIDGKTVSFLRRQSTIEVRVPVDFEELMIG